MRVQITLSNSSPNFRCCFISASAGAPQKYPFQKTLQKIVLTFEAADPVPSPTKQAEKGSKHENHHFKMSKEAEPESDTYRMKEVVGCSQSIWILALKRNRYFRASRTEVVVSAKIHFQISST